MYSPSLWLSVTIAAATPATAAPSRTNGFVSVARRPRLETNWPILYTTEAAARTPIAVATPVMAGIAISLLSAISRKPFTKLAANSVTFATIGDQASLARAKASFRSLDALLVATIAELVFLHSSAAETRPGRDNS